MDEQRLQRLAELARRGLPERDDPARDAAGQERLVAAVVSGEAREGRSALAPRRARAAVGIAFAAAIAAAIALLWPAPRLDYAVEGTTATAEGYVAAPAAGEARVRFSDGSVVALGAGASLRLAELGRSGARVLLEGGSASVEIAKRPGARWSVEAGPFAIEVTGTAFEVVWSREDEALRVHLREGEVIVRGPVAPDGVRLHAGQRLTARLREGDLQIQSAAASAEGPSLATPSPPPAESAAPAAQPAGEPGAPEAEAPADSAALSAGRADARPWSKRVAAGDFAGVIAEAEARGVGAVLSSGTAEELSALADAARYTGRSDLARQALVSLRRRFAATSAGRAAAFLLGRMVDTAAPAEAISWYDTYLSESPGGPFAAEALGRKMVATQRTAGRAAARAIAERYLARFPRGAHAATARDLIHP